MQSAMASAERIFGLLERPPAIVSPADGNTADRAVGAPSADQADGATTFSLGPPTSLPDHAAPATMNSGQADVPAIEFSSVWFAYDAAYVLRDCSFRVAAGEHVALVGATGEGKSTCARLLIRAYDVTRGRVLVDGIDVREWDLARLRRRVGTVLQDTVLFAGPVADHVTHRAALPPR